MLTVKIIKGDTIQELETKINQSIENGWVLYGTIFAFKSEYAIIMTKTV